MNRSAGFTLIELIITVMLAAIVLTIGVPSFRTAILNSTRVAQTNELIGFLNLARSEAAKSGFRVIICRSTNGTTCTDDITGVWENGWIVFVDRNQNNILDSGEIIKVQGSLTQNFTLRASGSTLTKWIGYLPNGVSVGNNVDGTATGLGTGTLNLCDSRGIDQARFIVISSTGRVRVREKQTGDVCP